MGGSSKIDQSQAQEQAIAAQQAATGQQLAAQGQQYLNQSQADQSPMETFLRGIIGGNSTNTNQAIAPVIGNIAQQTNANRESIYGSTAPGAARDVLLGQNTLNQGTQVASAKNSAFLNAFPQLASLGQQNAATGLNLTGGGITSTGNSGSTTNNVLKSQQQQKANALNAFTGLAGVAGNIATGGLSGTASSLFKSFGGSNPGGIPSDQNGFG